MAKSKKQVKHEAQDAIMQAVSSATMRLQDMDESSPELEAEIRKQVNRIERLFGYEVGSWTQS